MPLTVNLYREDEVLAALRWSLVRGAVADALFWVQEGIESDMDIPIFRTLLSVWLHAVGVQNIAWLGRLIKCLGESLSEEDIVSLTADLARSPKDSSVFALEALGLVQATAATAPDHVGRVTLPSTLEGRTELETAFAKALLQGKNELAWSLAVPLWSDGSADEILWEIQPLAVFNLIESALKPIWSEEFVWSFRALAILMATSRRQFVASERMPDPEHMDVWNARKKMTMRERRRGHPIPTECLYWLTERGQATTSESSEGDIMGSLRHMCSESPFWSDKLDYRIWDSYMTSDIPDEWSSADRQLSHGRGIVPAVSEPDHAILFQKSLKRLYGLAPSRLIWKGVERAIDILSERWGSAQPTSFEQGISEAYSGLEPAVKQWDLTPMRVVLSH